MNNKWRCKSCGRINESYVGTCGCGDVKENGKLVTDEQLKDWRAYRNETTNDVWRCSECGKVNSAKLSICSCGQVREKGEEFESAHSVTHSFSIGKIAILAGAAIVIVIAIILGITVKKSSKGSITGKYVGASVTNNSLQNIYYVNTCEIVLKDDKTYIYTKKSRKYMNVPYADDIFLSGDTLNDYGKYTVKNDYIIITSEKTSKSSSIKIEYEKDSSKQKKTLLLDGIKYIKE